MNGKTSGKPWVPQPHGGALVPGAGGGPQPGAGRPPDEWKRRLQALASRESTEKWVAQILDAGPGDKELGQFYFKALEFAQEHGYGKAPSSLDVTSGGEPIRSYIVLPDGVEEKI